ncbi:helix-turn-helix transcriptional regulator [Streptomyces macrosporus]|uniref:HTH cro/C1-type domain-containing protein n=1 Tax=Streptomyces macrosporus TaxID=44032 RepID=A0ABP5XQ23_9ACTN
MPTEPLPPWVLEARQRVGDRVREARTARGWSQEHLAHVAGLDRKTIYRIERAQYSTRIDHLVMVAAALGVPIGSLFS